MDDECHQIIKAHRVVIIAALVVSLRDIYGTSGREQYRQKLVQVSAAIRDELKLMRQPKFVPDPLIHAQAETVLLDASELALSILDGVPP